MINPGFDERGDELWSPRPHIEGLSDEESTAVYEGNLQGVLRSIEEDSERDRAIQQLLGAVGSRQKELHDLIEFAEKEWKSKEKADEYQVSYGNLEKFHEALLKLHGEK